ncbi:hypothetical protein R1flu_004594 [Riccia fluitans]|uniref:Leucine-rich repeat-containing N-terminal plant-type domain-containing protein n=1 Tax=Riccia fluitans TaxID=41844 RepID=A0ABD1YRK7_9MARC
MCHAQECNANDRNALLEFKAGFITYDFFFETWKSGSNCCQWNGVNCTSSGRVQGLRITNPFARHDSPPVGERNTSYTGVVGATLGDLTELRTLELGMILFNGPMPDTFNKLKKLEELSVGYNNFSGSLSPSIGGATSLKSLIAGGSDYRVLNPGLLPAPIPPSFCGLRNLETLRLSTFLLTGKLPECFCKFSQITDLLLAENRLEGVVPSCIGSSLGKLVSLDLSSNRFVGPFPTTLSRLTSLQTLYLYQNKFIGSIPSVIGNMGSLQVLLLANNSFSGAIPPSIGNLAELGTLDLSVNLFTRVLPEIGELTKLSYLSLSNNKLQGKLLPEIGKFGSQGFGLVIDVGYNKLSGSIPDVFASGNISSFSGSNNLFTGGFPLSLTMVGNVDLSHNSLSDVNSVGTLPLAPKLSVLNLANNVLSGPVPS